MVDDAPLSLGQVSPDDAAREALGPAIRDWDYAKSWLSAIVESSHDAIVSKSLDGTILTWNAAAAELFGYSAAEAVGRNISLIIPESRLDEEPQIIARIQRGERVDHFETQRRRKDGTLVDLSLTVSPVRNSAGEVIGASKIARDITARRVAEEQQRLILREMSHRVKNVFAVAASLVTLSARGAASTVEMAQTVRQRLNALTRAQALTRPGLLDEVGAAIEDTTLRDLMLSILSPFSDGGAAIALGGDEVRIGGNAITGLALIFNELATNAAKYGALGSSSGRLSISWTLTGATLELDWCESGGNSIVAPTTEGFGTTLTRRTVQGQFDGTIDYRWLPSGLSIHLRLDKNQLGWSGR